MHSNHAQQTLHRWAQKGRYVFNKHELSRLFPEDSDKTLTQSLLRLCESRMLERVCRGVYVYCHAKSDGYTIEHIAKALRPGSYNYVSLESMLSEYGVISQIPIDRLTVMTTGRKGLYHTHYGSIEFTHTKRSVEDILTSIISAPPRPLRVATCATAWRDLKRVGRNTNLVDQSLLPHDAN